MSRPSTPANTTIGTYALTTSVTVNNVSGLQGGATAGNAVARGADMAIWDNVVPAFIRPDQSNIGVNE